MRRAQTIDRAPSKAQVRHPAPAAERGDLSRRLDAEGQRLSWPSFGYFLESNQGEHVITCVQNAARYFDKKCKPLIDIC